ncbi:SDR family oxidoreductase [Agitococcus lubricus]|uniref:Short-subunit dehydrogenase n=1 Tax=Agitococcus lubricus TaxID=1077255 RepID=A0A2T5J3Q0_9GAMM|nr:SDR family oxidoreductase [Agitococcus lubricus]PTQ91222.1 short-subunit dehydrogenase [Agitococcus lubricus]
MTKNVIITGASSGIGAALAQAFASKGYALGLAARRVDKLEELARQLEDTYSTRVAVTELDVQDDTQVAPAFSRLAQELGQIDIVVANAGITGVRRSGNGNLALDKAILQTNLVGAIATLDAATKIFVAQGHGHLVGISSFSAFSPIPGSAAYSASKAALTNYMNAMRMELATKKIQVTVIHPGFIKTDIAPHMEKYPFVVEADVAAQQMVRAIEQKKANVIVPAMPWKVAKGLMTIMPDPLLTLMFTKFLK